MGGKTPEHEISLISGQEVVRNLSRKYKATPIVISKDGSSWNLISRSKLLENNAEKILELKDTLRNLGASGQKRIEGLSYIKKFADVVFIVMHGPFGEDGTVQGMLELAGISYTGPGVLASALGMDKLRFRKVLEADGIPIPRYVAVMKNENIKKFYPKLGKPPYFIKPNDQGSSVGCSIVRSHKELKKALNLAFEYSDIALIDEYVNGTEVTCGILGNDKQMALPLVEIVPKKAGFFDYDSKYTESRAEETVPANISKKLTKEVKSLAIKTYKAIGCKGFSRVDFILKDGKDPLILEINTIPGLTPMSLFPKAAKACGISYSKLLDMIIGYATK